MSGDPVGTTSSHLDVAFAEERHRGLRLATVSRLVTLAVIAVWINFENPFPAVLFYHAFIVAFAALGVLPLLLKWAGRDRWWHGYLFALLDVSLFTVIALVPNPLDFGVEAFPPQVRLRLGNELYLFIFLIGPVFAYSPRLVLWTGFAAALAWSAGALSILARPESIGGVDAEAWSSLTQAERLALFLHPHRVEVEQLGRLVVLLLVMSGVLAAAVWRSRRLVFRQAEAERERANLSRYFSPNMVEQLAHSDEPLGATRTQQVAVLFADIVGFTSLAAPLEPESVIRLLREFHRRMAEAVFEHQGTLDKYLGDGVMATFGTPHPGPRDATHALRCAERMVLSVGAWNTERAARGHAPIRIAVGAHYGPVVLGDIGSERQLEFAVIGDTVNVASRLEELTRALGVTVAVSGTLIEAVRREGEVELVDFEPLGPQEIRGREQLVEAWGRRRVQEESVGETRSRIHARSAGRE